MKDRGSVPIPTKTLPLCLGIRLVHRSLKDTALFVLGEPVYFTSRIRTGNLED